ncbi:MAG TPA: hypothetical protein VIC63_06110 [Candidatus Limnocylindria bacterium]|jgi:hypothetical protein
MTMMFSAAHPDPERLAALAGADVDALADRELTTHVKGCVACDRQVRELGAMHTALADLPDLTPSRPLQFLPPAAEPARPAGWRLVFRRAFAPVAVVGLALVLVGGLGASGQFGTDPAGVFQQIVGGASGGAPAEAPAVDTSGTRPVDGGDGAGLLPQTPDQDFETESTGSEPATDRGEVQTLAATTLSWVYVVATGLGLLVLAFVLWVAGKPARLAAWR